MRIQTFEVPKEKFISAELKFNEWEISQMAYWFRKDFLCFNGVVEVRKYYGWQNIYELLFLQSNYYLIVRAKSLKRAKRRFIAKINKQFK